VVQYQGGDGNGVIGHRRKSLCNWHWLAIFYWMIMKPGKSGQNQRPREFSAQTKVKQKLISYTFIKPMPRKGSPSIAVPNSNTTSIRKFLSAVLEWIRFKER